MASQGEGGGSKDGQRRRQGEHLAGAKLLGRGVADSKGILWLDPLVAGTCGAAGGDAEKETALTLLPAALTLLPAAMLKRRRR